MSSIASGLHSNNTPIACACDDQITGVFLIPEMFTTTYMQILKLASRSYRRKKAACPVHIWWSFFTGKEASIHTSFLWVRQWKFPLCLFLLPPPHGLTLYSLWPKWSGYKAKLMPLTLVYSTALRKSEGITARWIHLARKMTNRGREGQGAQAPSWPIL